MEGLIIESTQDKGQFKNFNERVEYLLSAKLIDPNESGNLLGVMKEYRDYSAHPTSKIFEKSNASLFINALIILTKELQSKKLIHNKPSLL
jgi:hypothetical protein